MGLEKDFALAGNRTRASRVAGENSTTEPPMHAYMYFWGPQRTEKPISRICYKLTWLLNYLCSSAVRCSLCAPLKWNTSLCAFDSVEFIPSPTGQVVLT